MGADSLKYQPGEAFARELDRQDPLKSYRDYFHFPTTEKGKPYLYFSGNSLGLQPKGTEEAILNELIDWRQHGVLGHEQASNPWLPYHSFLTEAMALVVGAKPEEVVVMNTLTVNLHLMMVSFYQPKGDRCKILIESQAFPSDRYAVESQIRYHGLDPAECLIELTPRSGESYLRIEGILEAIKRRGSEIALILLGNTNYYTGQFFDMKQITTEGHRNGCNVGFDCAHGVGNLPLDLHKSGADFAVWCSYKYLNSGPGSLGGCFVHERHSNNPDLPKFWGWWGHKQSSRFEMSTKFDPIPGAQSWQLSNPPIFSMAAIWNSLNIFKEVGMDALRQKSIILTGYLEYLIDALRLPSIDIITPRDPDQRGCQLSLKISQQSLVLEDYFKNQGVILDYREPGVIRMAPVPLYNSFMDVYQLVEILKLLPHE